MLERFGSRIGAIDLSGLLGSASAPPIDTTHVTSARTLFPEEPPKPQRRPELDSRPHFTALMSAPQSEERQRLLLQYVALCDEIDAFLGRAKIDRRAVLETKKSDLYARCRLAETEVKRLITDIGTANAQLNNVSFTLSELEQKAADVKPGYDSQFPSAEEVSKFAQQKAEAQIPVTRAKTKQLELKRDLQLLEAQLPQAKRALRDAVDELEQCERELQSL